ncbi:MAG: hypothetical protein BWY79_01526 [Actinobacteria bacterium ADurb.Bin444]|nr:MAG: hypothetical protein BWY79_01526 [Actinobacteria bacterium ADurb.Bin444]
MSGLRQFDELGVGATIHLLRVAEAQTQQPFERRGVLGAVQVTGRLVLGEDRAYLVNDFLGHDVLMSFLMLQVVHQLPNIDLLPVHPAFVVRLLLGRPKEDEHHGVHKLDILTSPLHQPRHLAQRVPVNGGIESNGDSALAVLVNHAGQLEPQLIEFLLGFPPPSGANLMRIYMEREPRDPGVKETHNQLRRKRSAVGIHDRFPALVRYVANQLNDVRIDERLPAGNGDAVRVTQAFDRFQFLYHNL